MLRAPRYETKIAVLEEKLSMYEEMLEKIDKAIQKISDSNSCITRMLAIHEERLEQSIKNEKTISDNIITSKIEHEREIEKLADRLDSMDQKMDDLYKFKWMAAGIAVVITLAISSITSLASGWLTPGQYSHRIEGAQVREK